MRDPNASGTPRCSAPPASPAPKGTQGCSFPLDLHPEPILKRCWVIPSSICIPNSPQHHPWVLIPSGSSSPPTQPLAFCWTQTTPGSTHGCSTLPQPHGGAPGGDAGGTGPPVSPQPPGHGTPRVAAAAGSAAAELRPAPRPRPALVPRLVPGGQAGPPDPHKPPGRVSPAGHPPAGHSLPSRGDSQPPKGNSHPGCVPLPQSLSPSSPGVKAACSKGYNPTGLSHPRVTLPQFTLPGLYPLAILSPSPIISPPSSWIYPRPRFNPTPLL